MPYKALMRVVSLTLVLIAMPWSVGAQSFPSKPVKFIVPYAAGGLPDTVARIVALKLTERMGHPVVVDNKPGGNGVVAYQTLMQGQNDHHVFIVTDGSMLSITPLINKSANYVVGKDLEPVAMLARSPLFLVTNTQTGIKSLREFVDKARAHPGQYTYGSSGIGSTHHLSMEALKSELKLDVRHVPFRGTGQSVPALIGAQVDFLFSALPSLTGFVKSNQVTLLGSNAAKRSAQEPDVPTISEVVKGYDFSVAIGALARSGTPAEVIRKLADDIAWAVRQPEVIEKFNGASIEPAGLGPEAYARDIERETQAMAKAGKAAKLKAE